MVIDEIAPMVTAVGPLPNASAVPVNTRMITAVFSEAMDPLTIDVATLSLACPAGRPTTGTVRYDTNGILASLTLASDLPAGTVCTATISTGARDRAGNALARALAWTFTTAAALDTTAPTVSSTSPLAHASSVAFNTLVSANFSEAMDPMTINGTTVNLACGAVNSVASVAYAVNGNVATLTPVNPLPASTVCTAMMGIGVKDLAGNALVSPYVWTFSTAAAADTTPPTVIATFPLANGAGMALDTLITASFSEAMDPLSINSTTVLLACPNGAVTFGAVSYAMDGKVAVLTPTRSLPANTTCIATITTSVKDVAGNALKIPFNWVFSTGATAADTTPPTVGSTSPVADARNVPLNAQISASFSEAMDPLTIDSASLKLFCSGGIGGSAISGSVTYAVNGNLATLTPTNNLPAGAVCTASISTNVKDVAGNALANLFVWAFSVAVVPP